MGVRRWAAKAAMVAVTLFAGARAGGAVQVEPVARLSLEGGWDSNVLYDGRGGNDMGRVSPELGVHLRDHTWSLLANAGGDLLLYPQRSTSTAWNQRADATLKARLTRRLTLDADARGTYAFDPIGLARLGIFNTASGEALAAGGKLRLAWRSERAWTWAGTFEEHVVRFADATGAASHTPGVEATRRLGRRLEAGGAYRFDLFQDFARHDVATAHEGVAVARWRWTRRLTLEGEAGGVVWNRGPATWVLPQAAMNLFGGWRSTDLRLTLKHGVGLGIVATPGLFDAAEAAVTWRAGRSWLLHADGGLWRSGDPPWGANAALGYGVEGEVAYRITRELRIGVAASRFARADIASTQFDRNVVGLRMTWESRHR